MAYSPEIYEKLGVFYLGRQYNGSNLTHETDESPPVLYASKDLTTHGVCVGMTGSGKTGLCLGLLEEAAIDQIPVIAIDPKGDVGNLLLTFPQLATNDLLPWVDPAVAEREGISINTLAEREISRLRDGLAQFGQNGTRIQRLRDSVEMTIYTPGSQAGRSLSLLRSFSAPSATQLQEPEFIAERIQSAVSGLLSLLGIAADPLRSREHILLSQILKNEFSSQRGVTLAELIGAVQTPSFSTVGVFELEAFFPKKERLELAMALNNLLAAPGAQALSQGEALEISSLLRTTGGKPKLSIISIAHLSDSERMAFVTTLLSEIVVWMRCQSGTSSLRALLYMDEIFGFFPPTAAPPSKQPMLTLLKQARAFGLGVMLATQNPVDLDYKGLSNCGTWFIGRLQTERDKARVLDGLEGAAASSGQSFDRGEIDRLLSGLPKRVFLMNNVHEGKPRLIETRTTLCYLRGPVTREEIKRLMHTSASNEQPNIAHASPITAPVTSVIASTPQPATALIKSHESRDGVPVEANEVFFPAFNQVSGVTYRPGIFARATLHFIDKKSNIDLWRTIERWTPIFLTDADPNWEASEAVPPIVSNHVSASPLSESLFAPLPSPLRIAKNYGAFRKTFAQYLYQSEALVQKQIKSLGITSQTDETPAQFAERVELALREKRDNELEELQNDYRDAFEKLNNKLEKANAKIKRDRQISSTESVSVAVTVGSGLLGALLGRKSATKSTLSRVETASRRSAKALRARIDLEQAEQSRELLEQAMRHLEQEFVEESAKLDALLKTESQTIVERRISPRKSDIRVETLRLAWRPD
jgi:hypothetical protein